jgi:hypothetical protein
MITVLVIADSLRADAPSFAGGAARTPFLDGLAAAGTSFEGAFASCSWTVPSLLSMLTASFPHRIGVGRWVHPFPARRPTLMTAFAAAGFEVRCFHPHPAFGFVNCPGRGIVAGSQDPAAVAREIAGIPGRDALVIVHHWWTHLPYTARELPRRAWLAACDFALESLGRYPERIAPRLEEAYLGTVSHFSEEVLGRYLDAASSGGRDALLAVTGDHGETWGRSLPPGRRVEHVYDLHGRWLSDETVRVPLVLHGKGASGPIPAGVRLGGVARGVDVAPTLAALSGVPWPGPLPSGAGPALVERGIGPHGEGLRLEGLSLAQCVMSGAPAPSHDALTVSSHNTREPHVYPENGRAMWRTLALRTAGRWHVFDGVDGTREIADAAPLGPHGDPVPAEVWTRLGDEWSEALDLGPRIPSGPLADPAGDRAVEERLRTMGYLD